MTRKTMLNRNCLYLLLAILSVTCARAETDIPALNLFTPDNPLIRYTGRVDFADAKHPRFWQPGVYIEWSFEGRDCEAILEDELLWGNSHNYIGLIVDGQERRIRMNSARDTITVAKDLSPGIHTVILVKDTEAGIGYLSLAGIRCRKLVPSAPAPARKIEFIGNSITCGMGSDQSEIACDKGVWYDQHNAFKSYGAITARALQAQYHLSAVSGIGLMHSCCDLKITMPQVFDKINMRDDSLSWDFSRYQPDLVTVCLGQNDGIQDSALFCSNYIRFLEDLRRHYPNAAIVCLTSPMADSSLTTAMKKFLTAIVNEIVRKDKNVHHFFFKKQYSSGCGFHPSLEEHAAIAAELERFLSGLMKW